MTTVAAYSRADAAAAASISEDILDAAIKKGKLKAKHVGRRVLIRPDDLAAYIDSLPDVEVKA